jgi:sarcosine oxidase subunit alpha
MKSGTVQLWVNGAGVTVPAGASVAAAVAHAHAAAAAAAGIAGAVGTADTADTAGAAGAAGAGGAGGAGGAPRFRRSRGGSPRAPLCGMGICFECRVEIDGAMHQRACMILAREQMRVRTDD